MLLILSSMRHVKLLMFLVESADRTDICDFLKKVPKVKCCIIDPLKIICLPSCIKSPVNFNVFYRY